MKTAEKQDHHMKVYYIGWVFQFGIFIYQETLSLWIYRNTGLKSAVSSVTALISPFHRTNKLER